MNSVLVYILALVGVCLIAKLLSAPLKIVFKLLANAVVGAIVLVLINFIGGFFAFHIDLNFITALIAGALGVPGVIILAIIELL